ncbi:MAG TPA: hypothetical protein PLN31_09450 [Azoarcus taiwanensis]|nr:hypothetical protein [Azoarcus taiwanensis]
MATNPFRFRLSDGTEVETTSVDDRVRKVKAFSLDQCNAALSVAGLQKTVERAVLARIRALGARPEHERPEETVGT